jgi:hypothetical protein
LLLSLTNRDYKDLEVSRIGDECHGWFFKLISIKTGRHLMYKTLKPYASMLFWFALGMTASLFFLKSLILSTGTDDAANPTTDNIRSQAPNLTLTVQAIRRSLPASSYRS